jgi:hypothetical protein
MKSVPDIKHKTKIYRAPSGLPGELSEGLRGYQPNTQFQQLSGSYSCVYTKVIEVLGLNWNVRKHESETRKGSSAKSNAC